MLGSKFIKVLMSILKLPVNSSSNFASFFIFMTHNSPVNLKLICFQLWRKESHQSHDFETLKCSGKNLTNAYYFPNHNFFFNFFYRSWVPSSITPLYFLIWSIICFGQKHPIKVQICEIFECSVQNLLSLSCQFWTSQFLFKFCIFLHYHNT